MQEDLQSYKWKEWCHYHFIGKWELGLYVQKWFRTGHLHPFHGRDRVQVSAGPLLVHTLEIQLREMAWWKKVPRAGWSKHEVMKVDPNLPTPTMVFDLCNYDLIFLCYSKIHTHWTMLNWVGTNFKQTFLYPVLCATLNWEDLQSCQLKEWRLGGWRMGHIPLIVWTSAIWLCETAGWKPFQGQSGQSAKWRKLDPNLLARIIMFDFCYYTFSVLFKNPQTLNYVILY